MEQISFTLPDSMISWIESLVADGRYASADEYLCSLLYADQSVALSSGEAAVRKEPN